MVTGSNSMDAGLLAAPTGPPARGTVWPVRTGPVPQLADGFTVRSETVPGIAAALAPGAMVALVPGQPTAGGARNGLSSCGKTAVACYSAESMWRSRAVDFLAWITATSRASVLSGYLEAAAGLGSDRAGDAESAESAAARLVGWLAGTDRRWLVVLDDLCDPADLDGLWPEGPAGTLLVTTADPATISGHPRALTLQVPVFSTREAMNYVAGRLTTDPDQRSGAIDLIGDMRCEPLALAQAAAVIVSSGLACRDYRQYFEQRRARLHALGVPETTASEVTWMVSADYAEQLTPGARPLLALAALLDGHGMPANVFTAQATCKYLAGNGAAQPQDPERARNALLSLEQGGLLTFDQAATPPTVRMSAAAQAPIRAALPPDLRVRAAKAAADAVFEVWPKEEPQPWLAADLRACALSVWRASEDTLWSDGVCHPALMLAGQSLEGARLAEPAVAYWRELGAVTNRVLGADHPDTLAAGAELAGALLTAGQAAEAATWYQWVVTGRTASLGPDDPGTLAARVSLGRAVMAAGRPDDALTVLSEAASAAERVSGADHADTLAARDAYAAACLAAGQAAEAIRGYRRSLADRERIQGPRHPDTMTASLRLADAHLAAGQVKEAVSQYKRVLGDRERALGPDHPDTLLARAGLASAYTAAGRMASALPLYMQTCDSYERTLGPDHPDALAHRADLARAYYAAGRLGEAMTMLGEILARCEQVLPAGHPLTQGLRETLTEITGG
jgi:tetratricopeptide (TPR) repeat protein